MIGQLTNPVIREVVKAPIFTPSLPDIGSELFNLDSSASGSFLFNGPNVSFWRDIFGTGNDASQVVMSLQPPPGTIFNAPGVNFGLVNDFLVFNTLAFDWTNNPFTIIVVATKRNSTGFRGLVGNRFGAGGGNWFTIGQESPNAMVVERTVPTLSSVGFNLDARGLPPQIYEFNHNGTDDTYLNGIFQNSGTKGNIGGVNNFLAIGRWAAASQTWDGLPHQILGYSKSIDADERQDIIAALSPKWQSL